MGKILGYLAIAGLGFMIYKQYKSVNDQNQPKVLK
jgi:hypothetical protein